MAGERDQPILVRRLAYDGWEAWHTNMCLIRGIGPTAEAAALDVFMELKNPKYRTGFENAK